MTGLDKENQIATLSSGKKIQYDALISTMPLDITLTWLDKKQWADGLTHRYHTTSGENNAQQRLCHLSTHPSSPFLTDCQSWGCSLLQMQAPCWSCTLLHLCIDGPRKRDQSTALCAATLLCSPSLFWIVCVSVYSQVIDMLSVFALPPTPSL